MTRYISLTPHRCGVARAVVLALAMSVAGTPVLSSAGPTTDPPDSPPLARAALPLAPPVTPVDSGLLAEVDLMRQHAADRPARSTAPPTPSPVASKVVTAVVSKAPQKKRIPQPPRRRAVAPVDGSRAAAVVAFALSQVGKPYRFATSGPDAYDCSGLAKAAYSVVGVAIPHQTGGIVRLGRQVERNDLAPGDLVFPSSGHVGIFVGGGRMVHAPQPGDHVKVAAVYAFWTARRLL